MERPEAEHRADGVRPAAVRRRLARWPVVCWTLVLVAIGVTQVVRAQALDATVFFLAAAAVVLTALRSGDGPRRWRAGRMWLGIGAAVAALALCLLPRHGAAMQLVVGAIGVTALILVLSGAAVARPDDPVASGPGIRRLAITWTLVVVAGCVWELVQFILGLVEPQTNWYSLSDLVDPLVDTLPGQAVFAGLWLAAGLWLLRRGGRR